MRRSRSDASRESPTVQGIHLWAKVLSGPTVVNKQTGRLFTLRNRPLTAFESEQEVNKLDFQLGYLKRRKLSEGLILLGKKLEPAIRIELMTVRLQIGCSTAELCWRN